MPSKSTETTDQLERRYAKELAAFVRYGKAVALLMLVIALTLLFNYQDAAIL